MRMTAPPSSSSAALLDQLQSNLHEACQQAKCARSASLVAPSHNHDHDHDNNNNEDAHQQSLSLMDILEVTSTPSVVSVSSSNFSSNGSNSSNTTTFTKLDALRAKTHRLRLQHSLRSAAATSKHRRTSWQQDRIDDNDNDGGGWFSEPVLSWQQDDDDDDDDDNVLLSLRLELVALRDDRQRLQRQLFALQQNARQTRRSVALLLLLLSVSVLVWTNVCQHEDASLAAVMGSHVWFQPPAFATTAATTTPIKTRHLDKQIGGQRLLCPFWKQYPARRLVVDLLEGASFFQAGRMMDGNPTRSEDNMAGSIVHDLQDVEQDNRRHHHHHEDSSLETFHNITLHATSL